MTDTQYGPLDADSLLDSGVVAVSSVCPQCHGSGTTRFLLVDIPHFRQIVLSSFDCDDCDHSNNEVMPAEGLADKGVRFTLKVSPTDTSRQIVFSSTATMRIEELDFEIPPSGVKGEINTLEGFLKAAAENLSHLQPQRLVHDYETAMKIQSVIDELRRFAEEGDFNVSIDDPAGNSYMENPFAPENDPAMTVERYERTREVTEALGYAVDGAEDGAGDASQADPRKKGGVIVEDSVRAKLDTFIDLHNAAVVTGVCSECLQEAEVRMCTTSIPYFKEVVIMTCECSHCGFRDTEVKPGGGVSDKGKKITLKVTSEEDLRRDLLKSDSAGISIPELELECTHGTLGGKYTTLEGILNDIYDHLSKNTFNLGDSALGDSKTTFSEWLAEYKSVTSCENGGFTFILDDPLGNIFVHNPFAPEDDPNMTIEEYERSFAMNEDLGLNDMVVDNYM